MDGEPKRDSLDNDPARRDGQLEELFAQYVDRLNRGEKIDEETILRSVEQPGSEFKVITTLLFIVILACWVLFGRQILYGLGVTGLNQPVAWGFYIVNFVFFIGISHAGTLISAILRVSGAEWRRPITRAAEAITVFALVLGATRSCSTWGVPIGH